MEVLVFCDDCGHMGAIDMTTPEQKLKVLEGLCKEAAKGGRMDAKEKKEVKDLLANKDIDGLMEFLDDHDLIHLNQRGGPSIVTVSPDWETGLGIGNF
jgi:hypothetical protein